MAQLIVRNLEHTVVKALQERAAKKGRSAEAEHREILRDALSPAHRARSLKSLLQEMPDAGLDRHLPRRQRSGRRVRV